MVLWLVIDQHQPESSHWLDFEKYLLQVFEAAEYEEYLDRILDKKK